MAEEIIIVQGNDTLAGEVAVSGAKNSALKLIAAALLGHGATTLRNVPLISDIDIMGEVLACNAAELDALLLGGETAVSLPATDATGGNGGSGRTRSLPPWERL